MRHNLPMDLQACVHLLQARLPGELTDLTASPVDLLDLRAASTVMQHQTLMQGERQWAIDVLTEKLHLDEARQGLIQSVMERGAIYA